MSRFMFISLRGLVLLATFAVAGIAARRHPPARLQTVRPDNGAPSC